MEEKVQATDGASDEKSGPKARAKSVKTVAITLVHQDKDAALVQWVVRGKLKRTIIPHSSIKGGRVAEKELAAGLPYGDDWTQVEGVNAAIAEQLRQRGIWVKSDVEAQPNLAYDAIMVGHVPVTIQALLDFVRED